MRRLLIAWLAVVAVGVGAGCGNNFDPSSYLHGLRVLAVLADPPELKPGQSTTLHALTVQTDEQPVEVTWSACTLPPVTGSGDSLNLGCLGADAGTALAPLGTGPDLSFTMPMRSEAQLGLPDFTFGVYYPILLRATSGDQSVTAVYRLRYHTPIDPNALNQNPQLAGIDIIPKGAPDGGVDFPPSLDDSPTVHKGDKLTLRALFADMPEPYFVLDQNGQPDQIHELYSVSWFATGGSISDSVTGGSTIDTVLTLDKHLPAAGEAITIYAIGHDERGGADWTRRVVYFYP